jgi:hypothetical protein
MASNYLENRIVKLELVRRPNRTYVVRVSDTMTKAELAQLAAARAEGRNVAIMPHKATCSSEEWAAQAKAAAAARRDSA